MNDFKIAKLDWQDILKTSTSGIYYTFKERKRLSTDDSSQSIDWVHWRDVWPTCARVRVITLEWFIDRLWNTEEISSVQYLENLFALQWDLWSLNERVLYIKDVYDNEWTIKVKIKEPLELIEWDEVFLGSHWRWRVVLESTYNPIYKSYNEILNTWSEWNFWGFKIGFKLGIKFKEVTNIIECITSWNIATPAKLIITAISDINSNLKILNITNNTYFWLDITAVSWDVIIVDSNTKTVTKNGINIIWNRIIWSVWPSITTTTKFVIQDSDWWILWTDFNVNVYYNNSLL